MISIHSPDALRLIHESQDGDSRELFFAAYLKKDFVARGLTLQIGSLNVIQSMRFQSNDHGIAVWINGSGFSQINVWEDEDAGIDPESLQRFRFPLLNGKASVEVAKKTIVPDIINYLPCTQLAANLRKIAASRVWSERFNLELARLSSLHPTGKAIRKLVGKGSL
ncbi:MAG: hypothetical protein K8S54_00440 [Spirochaetia bacterium]|nr:hypothetical protein [Spirochaetia bacterium]